MPAVYFALQNSALVFLGLIILVALWAAITGSIAYYRKQACDKFDAELHHAAQMRRRTNDRRPKEPVAHIRVAPQAEQSASVRQARPSRRDRRRKQPSMKVVARSGQRV